MPSRLAERRTELRSALGAEQDDVVVLSVARLAPEKGLDDLVRAVDEAADERLLLVVAGEGGERSRLEQLAGELGVKLVLTGDVDWERIVELYVAADVFALLSEREPWAVVVNEAAACGLPLVLSDRVGAAHDLLRDGENGALVAAGDVAAAAARAFRPSSAADRGAAARPGWPSVARGSRARLGVRARASTGFLESPCAKPWRDRHRSALLRAERRLTQRTRDSRSQPVLLARRRGDRASSDRALRGARGGLRGRGRHGRAARSRRRAAPDRAQRRRHHPRRVDVVRAVGARPSGAQLLLVPRPRRCGTRSAAGHPTSCCA